MLLLVCFGLDYIMLLLVLWCWNLYVDKKIEHKRSVCLWQQRCAVNPVPAMKEQLTKLEEMFVAQFMLATGDQLNSIASVRYSFASRLYYRTLFSLLKLVVCAVFSTYNFILHEKTIFRVYAHCEDKY